MDKLLRFYDKSIEHQYYQALMASLWLVRNAGISYFVCFFVLNQIGSAALNYQYYAERWLKPFIDSLIYLAVISFITLIKWMLSKSSHSFLFQHQKMLCWVHDILVFAAATFFLVRWTVSQESDTEPEEFIYYGWIIGLQLTFFSFAIFNWFPRAAYFLLVMFYLLIKAGKLNEPVGHVRIFNACVNVIPIIVTFYLFEKSRKLSFRKKNTLVTTSETWRKLMNAFPEGILAIDKQGKCIFQNKSLQNLTCATNEVITLNSLNFANKDMASVEELDKFQKLTLTFPNQEIRQLLLAQPGSNCEVRSSAEIDSMSIIDSPAKIRADDDRRSAFITHHDNLSVFLEHFLRIWRIIDNVPEHERMTLPNDQHVVILDSIIPNDREETAERSFHIKIWFTLYEGSQVMVLLFSETTQVKLVNRLQDRDAYKSKLLASVSHELRTPLNGSTNFIELVYDDERVPEDLKNNYLLPAIRSNHLLMNLINDILDFSQLQANKLRLNFDVQSVTDGIKECIQLLEIQAKFKKIKLHFDPPSYLSNPDFCTDHTRFKQILLNLLSNAIKFTREGYVKVKLLELNVGPGCNRLLKVEVEDTGMGISTQQQKKLFGAFTHIDDYDRKKVNPQGVGLGLMIANSLAVLLGPKTNDVGLKVISTPGIGSAFSFILEEKNETKAQRIPFRRQKALEESELFRTRSSAGKLRKGRTSAFSNQGRHNPYRTQKSMLYQGQKTKDRVTFAGGLPQCRSALEIAMISRKMTLEDTLCTDIPEEKRVNTDFGKYLRLDEDFNEDSSVEIVPVECHQNQEVCRCPEMLVVDDESFNLIAIGSILGSLEISAENAFNGEEAIEKAKHRASNPCGSACKYYKVIFMDCTMPIMNGFEAARQLRALMKEKKIPEVLIIACTALAQSADIRNAIDSGMDEVYTKPISKAKILKILSKL